MSEIVMEFIEKIGSFFLITSLGLAVIMWWFMTPPRD